jgi:hypothetical protein
VAILVAAEGEARERVLALHRRARELRAEPDARLERAKFELVEGLLSFLVAAKATMAVTL